MGAPGASQARPGGGLGRTISQNIIQHMGGMLGLESGDAKGSTFWFELNLPVLELDEAAASIDAAPRSLPMIMSNSSQDAHYWS